MDDSLRKMLGISNDQKQTDNPDAGKESKKVSSGEHVSPKSDESSKRFPSLRGKPSSDSIGTSEEKASTTGSANASDSASVSGREDSSASRSGNETENDSDNGKVRSNSGRNSSSILRKIKDSKEQQDSEGSEPSSKGDEEGSKAEGTNLESKGTEADEATKQRSSEIQEENGEASSEEGANRNGQDSDDGEIGEEERLVFLIDIDDPLMAEALGFE